MRSLGVDIHTKVQFLFFRRQVFEELLFIEFFKAVPENVIELNVLVLNE